MDMQVVARAGEREPTDGGERRAESATGDERTGEQASGHASTQPRNIKHPLISSKELSGASASAMYSRNCRRRYDALGANWTFTSSGPAGSRNPFKICSPSSALKQKATFGVLPAGSFQLGQELINVKRVFAAAAFSAAVTLVRPRLLSTFALAVLQRYMGFSSMDKKRIFPGPKHNACHFTTR